MRRLRITQNKNRKRKARLEQHQRCGGVAESTNRIYEPHGEGKKYQPVGLGYCSSFCGDLGLVSLADGERGSASSVGAISSV